MTLRRMSCLDESWFPASCNSITRNSGYLQQQQHNTTQHKTTKHNNTTTPHPHPHQHHVHINITSTSTTPCNHITNETFRSAPLLSVESSGMSAQHLEERRG